MTRRAGIALLLAGLAAAPCRATSSGTGGLCASGETDDSLRPLPPRSLAAAARSLDLPHAPLDDIRRTSVYRCVAGTPLVCTTGANLPCGRADTRRALPAADAYCRTNPGADSVPMFVTGHDTRYVWRCRDGAALSSRPAPLDARGFFARYWFPLR